MYRKVLIENSLYDNVPKRAVETVIYMLRGKKVVAVAGIVRRYFIFRSLFVATNKDERGKGIATFLIKKVLEQFKGKIIFLTVRRDNHIAISLYQKLGFKKICNWRQGKYLMYIYA